MTAESSIEESVVPRSLLERQVAEISEREQRRIGEDLHDGLCQELVSACLTCGVLSQQLRGMPQADTVRQLAALLEDCIGQARALARAFYPVRLEVEGLASALDDLAATAGRRAGIRCRFVCARPPAIHDHVAEVTLYRIAQEALANALRHSQANEITIGLDAIGDEVALTIGDNGIGFTPHPHHNGMGLHMMRYRARIIDATLDIRPGPISGTVVSCFFQNAKPPLNL
jgi:signal transduction histidine kinase